MSNVIKRGAEGTPSNDPDLIDAFEVAKMMGLTHGSFRYYRCTGRPTPPPLYKHAKNLVFSRRQVEAWLSTHEASPLKSRG